MVQSLFFYFEKIFFFSFLFSLKVKPIPPQCLKGSVCEFEKRIMLSFCWLVHWKRQTEIPSSKENLQTLLHVRSADSKSSEKKLACAEYLQYGPSKFCCAISRWHILKNLFQQTYVQTSTDEEIYHPYSALTYLVGFTSLLVELDYQKSLFKTERATIQCLNIQSALLLISKWSIEFVLLLIS